MSLDFGSSCCSRQKVQDSESEALGELAGIVFPPPSRLSFLMSEGVCMRRELRYPDKKKSASPSKARSHVVKNAFRLHFMLIVVASFTSGLNYYIFLES